MALIAECPKCQEVIKTREENAGKRVRCPSCGTVFMLPADSDEPPEAPESPEKRRKSKKSKQPQPEVRPLDARNIVFLSLGIVLLIAASLSPIFSWFTLSMKHGETRVANSSVTGQGGFWHEAVNPLSKKTKSATGKLTIGSATGRMIMILGFVLTGAVGLCFGLGALKVMPPKQAVSIASYVGAAAGVLILIVGIGLLLKVVLLTRTTLQKETDIANDMGLVSIDSVEVTASLALGPFLAIGLGAVLAYLFSQVGERVSKRQWLYVAEGTGLLVGVVIAFLLVKPTDGDSLWSSLRAAIIEGYEPIKTEPKIKRNMRLKP